MGRDFRFRILLKGVPVPDSLDEMKRSKPCECWTGCDECNKVDKEYNGYATSWEDCYGITRYNDVLGYCYHTITDISGLRKKIEGFTEEMSLRVKNGSYDIRDYTDVLNVFEYIHRQLSVNPAWLVEIKYD